VCHHAQLLLVLNVFLPINDFAFFQPVVLVYGLEHRKIIALTFEFVILLAISCEVICDSALYCSLPRRILLMPIWQIYV
jgi:hypothetical protein